MEMVMGVLKRCLHHVRRRLFSAIVASREDCAAAGGGGEYRVGVEGLGRVVVVVLGMAPMGMRSVPPGIWGLRMVISLVVVVVVAAACLFFFDVGLVLRRTVVDAVVVMVSVGEEGSRKIVLLGINMLDFAKAYHIEAYNGRKRG